MELFTNAYSSLSCHLEIYLNHIKLLFFKSKQSNIRRFIRLSLNSTEHHPLFPSVSNLISRQSHIRPASPDFNSPDMTCPPTTVSPGSSLCLQQPPLPWETYLSFKTQLKCHRLRKTFSDSPTPLWLHMHTNTHLHIHTHTHRGSITPSQTFMVGPQLYSNYLFMYLPPPLDYEHVKAEIVEFILSAPMPSLALGR